MKIVYDHQIFNLQKYGGISRYFYEISTRLDQFEDCEVKVLAGLYVNEYLPRCPPNLVNGWKRPSIPKTDKVISFISTLSSKFWVKSHSPNIVHETYYTSNSIASSSSRTVVTVYDMVYEKFADLYGEKSSSSIKLKAINRADQIICISENTKKDLVEIFDIDPQRITVVYLGYSINSDHSKQEGLQPNPHAPYILYVGDRGWYKNFPRLLQAYANSASLNHNFNLLCMGGKKFSQDETNLIQSLGLSTNKIRHINGDDQDLARLYRQASAFVYPSLYEGFGIPLLEAMSFGCPVVCSNTSSFPEVAGNACEFFDPYDHDSIGHALEKVLFSTELSKQLVDLGKERIKSFSWEKCAEQTYSVYTTLI